MKRKTDVTVKKINHEIIKMLLIIIILLLGYY